MQHLTVDHKTTYRYAKAVKFGEHRLMFRPRDSHDLRLLDARLTINPTAEVRWTSDVSGQIGIGAQITTGVTDGPHLITCEATDPATGQTKQVGWILWPIWDAPSNGIIRIRSAR